LRVVVPQAARPFARLFSMSANDATVAAPAGTRQGGALRARVGALVRSADGQAVAGLLFVIGLLAAVSWRKWGTPEIDAGSELTTAAQAIHGHLPYDDVRYFYGPLGLYTLAGAFKLLGATLTTAYALGLAVTVAIVMSFYALARQLLRPLAAGLSAAVLVAIGFSGTQFNFILPHTNSATFGLLLLLLELLALSRGRPLLGGVAIGLAGLTRVEFAAAAAIAGLAWLIGSWRSDGRQAALRTAAWLIPPAVAIPLAVLGALAASVGTSRLLWENLWPVDFLRIAGLNAYREWTPFDAASVVSSLARGLVYGALLAGLAASVVKLRVARGTGRIWALWPLGAALISIGLVAGAWRTLGIFDQARAAVQEECTQLIIGMSWLPMLSLAAALLVGYRFLRRERAPLSGSWSFDLALAGVALLLCSRAYDEFTMSSAAPYYAAPAVLLLGLLHQRVADRWPTARVPVMGALGAVAAGIALYTLVALYPDKTTVVHTAAGSYIADDRSAPVQQQAIDFVRRHTAAGEPVLALPADAGMYFLTDRPTPLYENMFLPGLLDTRADERAAIARLRRERVRYALVSTRDTAAFDSGRFGEGYNRILGAYLRSGRLVATFGDPSVAPGGGNPSRGFRVYALR
jgi:4-amino-4-deoxy-L-arabinose transferase-like glycosyltransferase